MKKFFFCFMFCCMFLSSWGGVSTNTFKGAMVSGKTISTQEALLKGSPSIRLHALSMISQGRVKVPIDDSFLPGLISCATNKNVLLRIITTRILGEKFIEGKKTPNSKVITLLKKLANDSEYTVRFNAVFYGLIKVEVKSDALISFLIDQIEKEREERFYNAVVLTLRKTPERTTKIMDQKIREKDTLPRFEIYKDITGKTPTNSSKYIDQPSSLPMLFVINSKNKDLEKAKKELSVLLEKEGVKYAKPFILKEGSSPVLLLKTCLTKNRLLVEKLFSNPVGNFTLSKKLWVTPSLSNQLIK